jgi:2,3-bisphosphoglycerate-independent phosphoglycerate mutase
MILILDGWGLSEKKMGNAIAAARTPVMDSLWRKYPHSKLGASGTAIGLPSGQQGGSEVGHLTIGAGRVVYQGVVQIGAAIQDGSFFKNKVFLDAIDNVKKKNSNLHIMGLLSDEGVHSMDSHLFALLELAKKQGIKNVYVHAFLDGRDSPPTSGIRYLKKLQEKIEQMGIGKLASVIGRYYAMDRDKRWDRIKKAYDLLVNGQGLIIDNPVKVVDEFYNKGITDEFMESIKITGTPDIKTNDSVIMFNFRPDRVRQITWAFTEEKFTNFKRGTFPKVHYVCMAPYHKDIKAPVAFYPQEIKYSLGEVVSNKGLKQLRISETEKYAHVTFFFSGGKEDKFPGEERILIPSPREVGTYDKKPEMSAYLTTDSVLEEIRSRKFDFILMNLANADMVGHTGVFQAAVKAVQVVDECVGKIVDEIKKQNGQLMIIADHGNADEMIDDKGNPVTAHSLNPVPCILISAQKYKLRAGSLLDVAPTILDLMNQPIPKEMTGKSLIQ